MPDMYVWAIKIHAVQIEFRRRARSKNLQKRGLAAAQCSTTILPIYIAIEGEMGTFLQLVRVTNTSTSHLQFGAGSNNPILQLTHGLYRSFFLECSI